MLEQHEQFEIETLDLLNNRRLLLPLAFGGGTMLRLCHGLNRYSADLDFWLIKPVDHQTYLADLKQALGSTYEITDSHDKQHSLICEFRSPQYPRRLKIEIRKEITPRQTETGIAYSTHSTIQVQLRVHTLAQTMDNKVQAALERQEIRDCFDIEFLLRRGIALPRDRQILGQLVELVHRFGPRDYKVTLGSLLDGETREYYVRHGFALLGERITAILAEI